MSTPREKTVESVKGFLRITHDKLDADISGAVDSCLLDLAVTAGVINTDESDPLILSAIKLYYASLCPLLDAATAESYQRRYDEKKSCLQMAFEYQG